MTKKNKITLMKMPEFEKLFFKNNAEQIRAFLNVAIEEYLQNKNKEEFLQALALAVKWAGVSNVASKSNLTRQGIYNAIKTNANPSFTTVMSMLHGVGFDFKII